jgi:hypothetical protein
MDPREFFVLLKRRLSLILVGVLVFSGVAFVYTGQLEAEEGTTIFVTMGATLPNGVAVGALGASQNENVVDQFTQTVQGWVSNPDFQRRVEEHVGEAVSMGVRKQEKQNLIVTVSPEFAALSVMMILDEEMLAYNEQTNTSFVVALSSMTSYLNEPNLKLNLLMAVLLGFLVMGVGVVMAEYLRRTLTFEFQVASFLGDSPLVRLKSKFVRSDLDGFLTLYSKGNGRLFLLELGDTGFSHHRAHLEEHRVYLKAYPKDLKGEMAVDRMIVVVKLGVSSEDHVREIRMLIGKSVPYLLIV